jgi:hypothetical protein
MNDSKENYENVEKFNRYYHYNIETIKKIISKDVRTLDNEEWRTLIQMLYPDKMIASGLFQPILIFKVRKDGKRIDPPIEAYDSVDQVKGIGNCLIFRIIDFIESNSNLKLNNTWYEIRKKIEEGFKNED